MEMAWLVAFMTFWVVSLFVLINVCTDMHNIVNAHAKMYGFLQRVAELLVDLELQVEGVKREIQSLKKPYVVTMGPDYQPIKFKGKK